MPEFLDAPLFIQEGATLDVDISKTPYFYNDRGTPKYLPGLPEGAKLLEVAPIDPALALGNPYPVGGPIGVHVNGSYGVETELEIDGMGPGELVYEPMWATRENASAFGITLVEPGEAVKMSCPVPTLQQVTYTYGVFAGHWSPYQNTGNELLSVVCTDLEHHDFPHVFASIDPDFPLVTSVGRYWPSARTIRLADLWVPRGSALYIPPMPVTDPDGPPPDCIDLHNNRNSARACWGQIARNSIETDTLLQTENGYFYWYWNPKPTVHTNLPEVTPP